MEFNPMAEKIATGKRDPELEAIGKILGALAELEGESIQRVLDYVLERLSLGKAPRSGSQATSISITGHAPTVDVSPASQARRISIRDLKDEKRPTSANQMAALVAYYLSEVVDHEARKEAINSSDLQTYFKQAGFRLPKLLRNALPNAAAAGYFNAVGNGLYRLNPVGYNLVVHKLPYTADSSPLKRNRLTIKKSR
jgi:hypothetical protein